MGSDMNWVEDGKNLSDEARIMYSINDATPEEWDMANHNAIQRTYDIEELAELIQSMPNLTPQQLAVELYGQGVRIMPASLTEQAI